MDNLLKYPYTAQQYASFAAKATKMSLELSELENHDICMVSPREDTLGYRQNRELAYPPLAEQLDMIYHDMVNHTTVWKDFISSIKKQYPKK